MSLPSRHPVPSRCRLARVLLVLGALMWIAPEAGAQQSRSFAIIKCKFADQPQEPAFDPNLITASNGAAGYWRDISYGWINLNGTVVFPSDGGWYTLPITLAEWSVLPTRTMRIQACVAGSGVDVSAFYSVIVILNAKSDSGAGGGMVVLDPDGWDLSFATHEIGHVFGLDHSFDDRSTSHSEANDSRPGAYGNGWDIMSAMTFGNQSTTFMGAFGISGPGMNAPTLEKSGWLGSNQILNWDRASSSTFRIAALNEPTAAGLLMAKLYVDPIRHYTVEFRRKKDWDQGIPNDTVLIHQVRADALSYLMRGGGGAERLAGQTYRDTTNNIAISVLSIDPVTSTAMINIGRNEVWVDFNFGGPVELGSLSNPYNTLAEGVNTVALNGTVKIKAGSANETATLNRSMRIEAVGGTVTIGQ